MVIRDLSDGEAFQISLVENLQRQDLNPVEEAEGYHRLIEDFCYTPELVGEVLGKSRSHVSNMIRLLQLPAGVREKLARGDMTQGHARALINVANAEKLAEQIVAKKLSVRQTEKLVSGEQTRSDATRHKTRLGKNGQSGFAAKTPIRWRLKMICRKNWVCGLPLIWWMLRKAR